MPRATARTLIVAASLVAVAGMPFSVFAQGEGAAPPAAQPTGSPQPAGEAAASPPKPAAATPGKNPIRFNFKEAPVDLVLDFFARESGVPIIYEAAAPQGAITFVSGSGYSFEEALSILNLNLRRFGVHLRRQEDFLYLATMQESMKKPTPVANPASVAGFTPDQIVTVSIPLDNARAEQVAEQIRPMVGEFGGVLAVPPQNMVIVVETAGQVQRIREIIGAIDSVRPADSAYKLFPLKYAQAEVVLGALKGLVGERTRTVIVDKDGKQRVVEELQVSGLNLAPDVRTNSIVAVGPETRIRTVEELIAVLDVPEQGQADQRMITFTLTGITPDAAAKQINALFASVDAKRRPTVITIPEQAKLTLVGGGELLNQATALLSELDPGAGRGDGGEGAAGPVERESKNIGLTHIQASTVESLAARLLTPRQLASVRFAAAPGGRSLVVVGPKADVAAFEAMVAGLDVPATTDREVRLVRLSSGSAAEILDRAKQLYQETGGSETAPVTTTLDAESRTVTLVGPRQGIEDFQRLLTTAESIAAVDQEARRFTLEKSRPSALADKLRRMAEPLLRSELGNVADTYAAPQFEAIDELATLIVRAQPSQFTVLEGLIEQLDGVGPGDKEFRVVKLGARDAAGVLARARKLYDQRTQGLPAGEGGPVVAELDEVSGSVILTASPSAMRLFTESLQQVQQLLPPERVTRLIEVRNVPVASVVEPLRQLLGAADPIDPSRKVPDPTIQVIERTNTLVVTAEEAQHRFVQDAVIRLDRLEPGDLPPIRLLQLRTADAQSIANVLAEQYNKRPQQERMTRPVDIRADQASNTLIVSAHAELFDEIKQFVEELNRDARGQDARVTQLFQLKVAKAVDVAAAMDRLFPEPPVPVDRFGRPQPWLKQPKEVSVSAEATSNSLIIDAPADRMESLQELAGKLDRVELPPQAELRTYRISNASLDAVAKTLRSMSDRGILSEPAQPGKQPVQVTIETEPRSSTLIVAGDNRTFETVERVLEELSLVPVEKGLRIIPIANEDAGEVRARAMEIYTAQVAQIPDAKPIEVTVDDATNSLMVVADGEGMARFVKVVEELQRQAGPAREVRLIELELAKAEDVLKFLSELVASSETFDLRSGPKPQFEVITATNTIMAGATPAQFAVIEPLIRQLDSAQAAERPPLRILRLRSTDAANLASVLQRSYDTRPIEQRGKLPVRIEADSATNTLIVSAHPDVLPEIEAIVTNLNETRAVDAEGREIRIFPLKVARAEELAQTIDQMFPEPPMPVDPRTRQPRPDLRQPKEVVVRADRATNSLIVDAPGARLAGFEQIVASLDQQKLADDVELKTYRVQRADLTSVTNTLRSLASAGSLGAPGKAATAPISINSEPATRTLIVSGPTEIFAAVEDVLSKLDEAPDRPATALKMYGLAHARADRLQPVLERLLIARLREQADLSGKPAAEIEQLVEVVSDVASNTLIISAPEDVQRIAEQLIEALDSENAATGRTMIRVVPLSFGDPQAVSQALSQSLAAAELPSGGKVAIVPVIGSNALLLSGAEADLKRVEELVKPLDVRPGGADTPSVETFALTHADATQIAKTVESLLVQQQETDPRIIQLQLQLARQGRQDLFKRPSIRVEASARNNSLIVSAPLATIELAKAIVERLDQPAGDSGRTASTFTPARASAAELASTVSRIVNETLPQGRGPAELSAEPSSGSVVVIGSPEQVAESLRLLAEFDDRAVGVPGVDVRAIELKNAEAASLATTLQGMLADRSRWPDELVRADRAGLRVAPPSVTADRGTNRLIVSAPSVLMPMAMGLIETLDGPAARTNVEIQVYRLSKGNAQSAAQALSTALAAAATPGEPAPKVAADTASNTLIVTGSPAAIAAAGSMVEKLDQAVEPAGMGVRTIYLKQARAEAIAPVLEAVLVQESALDKLPDWARATAIARGADEGPKIRVAAEPRLNAIVVSGPKAVLDLAEETATALDRGPEGPDGLRPIRVITLQNADATQLAANLEAVFAEAGASQQPPTIRVDAQSNSLIVRATMSQMATVEELTTRLDRASLTSTRQMRMIPVDRSRADAQAMARTLQRLMEQRGGVKVEVISTEELLRRGASPQSPETEPPAEENTEPRGSRRQGMNDAGGVPGWMAAIVTTVVAQAPQAAQPQPAAAAPSQQATENDDARQIADALGLEDVSDITIAVDPATNSLIVVGSPRATDRVADLAQELERQMPAEPAMVRIVDLPPQVDARQVADLVRATVQQIGRAGQNNPGGFTGPVSVIPDPAGASVVVLCNDTDFATVGQVIASIAQPGPAEEISIKIYPLTSITAQRAIQSVRDLFTADPRSAQARRVRNMDISLAGPDGAVTARIEPSSVRLTADPAGTSVIVAAPAEAMGLIDRLIESIDQSPVRDRLAIRRYDLTNARAAELRQTLQQLFDAQRQGPGASELPRAQFVADERTNALLVTASDPQHQDIARLLETADGTADGADLELAILTLQQASPSTVRRVVEEVVIGRDPAKRDRVRISADDSSSLFVVRAPREEMARVRELVAEVDRSETTGLPVRSIKLEKADAQQVAQALQRFFQDRATASSRPGVRVTNRVVVVGDRRTGTLVVAASDDDYAQVQSLVETFDTPAPAQDLIFKVVPLKHARASELSTSLRNVIDELRWESMWGGRGDGAQREGQVYIEANERTNTVVVIGRGEIIPTVESVISALDQPAEDRTKMVVRSVEVTRADLATLRSVITQAFSTPGWSRWRGPDPEAVVAEIDRTRRAIVLVGKAEQVEKAANYIRELDGGQGEATQIVSIALQHADAQRAAQSLRQFFQDRARAQGIDTPGLIVIGSREGNTLLVSGEESSLAIMRDLVAQIDQPDQGKDRRIEVFAMKNSTAADTAGVLRAMFARSGPDDRVLITPQPSTNSLIVSAPATVFPEVEALLKQLDAPPAAEETNIVTIALATAKAADVASALRSALPPTVKVTVTPVPRSNSLLLTGSKEAIAIAMDQVKAIDSEPVRSGLVFKKFKLEAADASAVSFTIGQLLRARPRQSGEPEASIDYSRTDNTLSVYASADQLEAIETMIDELDVPATDTRTTEFIKLEYANAAQTADALKNFYGRFASEPETPAARNVTIIADPVSNSLVIRAEESQWAGIRGLLGKLDTPDYDTTRQLTVIPLIHADAQSVARALNEGLRAPLEEQFRQERLRLERDLRQQQRGGRDFLPEPTVLVDTEGLPTVSAEVQTNSLIVFAGRRDMERIRDIVRQLDVAGFADMPMARIIPLRTGKPSDIAATIRELFLNRSDRTGGPRSVLVIGDNSAGALIVRADDEQFAQIRAMVETLQQQGEIGRVRPHVLRLEHVAAGRLRQTLLSTFTATAQAQGETLAIEIDRTANALVIAASDRLLEEIRRVIAELDKPAFGAEPGGEGAITPGLGQSVAIVDLTNNAPADIVRALEAMGVTRAQPAERPGLVSEPVTLTELTTRRAVAVVASPPDVRIIESLVRALDSEPLDAQLQVAVIPLKLAAATPVTNTLRQLLSPAEPANAMGPLKGLTEHLRRLGLSKTGLDQPQGQVDLTKPIRLIADVETNSVLVSSTPANIAAMREIVKLLDTLPIGDAVLVRIMPIENSSATRLKQVIDQLFAQGEALRRLPGTQRRGLPPTTTGQALAGEIAVTVDERTNSLIVAGREEAVALVEVLIRDLDSAGATNWIEPQIIRLEHADATSLARRLTDVLIRGLGTTPEAAGLQRQFGRLRVVLGQADPARPGEPAAAPDPSKVLEADLYGPLSGLSITADETLNAIIVIGSPANNAVVRELIGQLDVEAASAANTVRVFPLKYAAAERIAAVVREVFRQRESLPDQRPEDTVVITPDVRTNALVVTTSPRSFAILESLLKTLDGEKANFSVGLHVIPVQNVDVRQLAPRIERIMRERLQAAAQAGAVRQPQDAFSIEAEPASNLLIVAASDENLAVVRELVEALSRSASDLAGSERVEIINLARVRAAEAAQSIRQLYTDKENARRGQDAVSVVANDRLNALIVNGTEQDIIEVRALAMRLDKAEVTAKQQIRWIELKSANALEVVNLIESVLAGRPVGGRPLPSRQATTLQFIREKVKGELTESGARVVSEADIDGAIKDLVTLTPDVRTNSIWITAPEAMVNLIEEMVSDIERSTAGSRRIEYFQLKNADARAMAELLRDTFNLRQQGNSLVLVPTRAPEEPTVGADGVVPPPGGLTGASVTAVPDERQQLSIAIDGRTNTLVVSGTDEYLTLVRDLITELDKIEANERERTVYHLRNAKAKELEVTLQSYFRGDTDRERLTLGPDLSGSLLRRLEQEVTVVGDEKSNRLVISTSPRYMDTVLRIVEELDSAPPQVMIQVLLAEVTIDSSSTWGMDISVGPLGGEALRLGSQAAGAGVATALGVPNLSISAQDFGLLIRALEAQGKLEVLSNPQVMVNNNQIARIQVGENVAIVDGFERTAQGNSFANVDRRDVGIIMDVTPSISADGFVRMEIKPEISQLTNRTVQVSDDVFAPIISQRTVETVVTVKDGQSVVIGGLIQTSEERRRTKVPILGDIPLLGMPFRSYQNTSVKTELLVILTPRVIPGDAAKNEVRMRGVTENALDRIEDPSRVEDYLEQINAPASRPPTTPGGRFIRAKPVSGRDGGPVPPDRAPTPGQDPPASPGTPPIPAPGTSGGPAGSSPDSPALPDEEAAYTRWRQR